MTVDEIMAQLSKLQIYGHVERNNPRQKVLGFSHRELIRIDTGEPGHHKGYKTVFTLTVLFDAQTQQVAEWYFDEAYNGNQQMQTKLEKILN